MLLIAHTYTIQKIQKSSEKKSSFSTHVLCQSLSQPVHFQLFDLSNFDRLKEIVKSNRLFLHKHNRCILFEFFLLKNSLLFRISGQNPGVQTQNNQPQQTFSIGMSWWQPIAAQKPCKFRFNEKKRPTKESNICASSFFSVLVFLFLFTWHCVYFDAIRLFRFQCLMCNCVVNVLLCIIWFRVIRVYAPNLFCYLK